ncbi:MAG: hypothetical protein EA359_05700 [Balneolaceae bacterium]|nr:MAG: hypothetical protein EA359_05700 [Balneolaceae bacterium]
MTSNNYMRRMNRFLVPVFLKIILLCLFSIMISAPAIASDIHNLLKKAAEQMEQMDEEGALETYLKILELDPQQYDALWNSSLLYATIGFRFDDNNRKKVHFERAVEMAEKSVENHPDKVHPYYVMAVAKGRMTNVVGTRTRIRLAYVVEENVKKALEIMPDHAPSWHLYGVWHSEVANVGRAERLAARFISRGLPDGSVRKAEEYLLKAKELDPESILIRLDLARHYHQNGQRQKAIDELKELLSFGLKPQTKDDPDHLEDARELLNRLG